MSSDRPGRHAHLPPEDGEVGAAAAPVPSDEAAVRPGKDAAEPPGNDAVPAGDVGGRHRREKKSGSLLRELPVLLLVAFGLALLVKTFFVQAFFIPSGSMEQTLHGCPGCTGDRVLVNKIPYWFGSPEPGDIVVFQGPDTWSPEVDQAPAANWFSGAVLWLGRTIGVAPPSEDDFVKRVIAVGGQTVQCCDSQGRLMVDGKPLDEPYIYQNNPIDQRAFSPVTVPQGRLWVMGDHRAASADSRVHVGDRYSGTVGTADVIGKAEIIVWPLGRFQVLHAPRIQSAQASAADGTGGAGGPVLAVPVATAAGVGRRNRPPFQ